MKNKNTTKYYCQRCKEELNKNQSICPYCGSKEREIKAHLYEEGKLRESLGIKKFKKDNLKKWIQKSISGWFPSGDKGKHPEGVERVMIIDREDPDKEGSYQEKVEDVRTGKIIRYVKEKLREHKHREN